MTVRTPAALALGLLAAIAPPLSAQYGASAPAADRATTASLERLWSGVAGYITQVAEETAEADYAYRPTEGVRSIGELIAHVAGAHYVFCAAALGDPSREEDEVARTAKTKSALVEALKASAAYCAKAYAQSDKALQVETQLFGQKATRLDALGMNAVHDGEHYGNLVTYLRMRGVVPPSSRGGS